LGSDQVWPISPKPKSQAPLPAAVPLPVASAQPFFHSSLGAFGSVTSSA
jgi:hypothetical protein